MKRKDSFTKTKSNRKFSFNRPNSASRSYYSRSIKKNIPSIKMQPPPIVFTHPNNNQKKLKGMGNKFEREELYQINMQLKETVNSLKKDLYEAKSQIVKKDRELKKKEKIIDDCYKEINNPSSLYMQSFDKAKESTLLTLCREQYNQLKNDYDKKLEEIEILKENIKITKLKEYQIDIDVLKKEMNKLRNLYNKTFIENNRLKEEINNLNIYKDKCNQQHSIINECVKQVKDYNNDLHELELQNEELQNQLYKNQKKNKIMKNQNSKLKLTNEKYLRDRRNREHFKMFNTDNINKIMVLQKELDEYKRLYALRDQEFQKMAKTIESQKNLNMNIDKIKAFDYQNVQHIERNPAQSEDEKSNKILLLKSLLEEKQKNNEILKSFLYSINYDPDKIIQDYNLNFNNSNINDISKITNKNSSAMISPNKNDKNSTNNLTKKENNNEINILNNKSEDNNNGNTIFNSNSDIKNNENTIPNVSNNNGDINNKEKDKDNNGDTNNNVIDNNENQDNKNEKVEIDNNNDENNNSQLYNAGVINDQNVSDNNGKESYIIPNSDNSLNITKNKDNADEEEKQ